MRQLLVRYCSAAGIAGAPRRRALQGLRFGFSKEFTGAMLYKCYTPRPPAGQEVRLCETVLGVTLRGRLQTGGEAAQAAARPRTSARIAV